MNNLLRAIDVLFKKLRSEDLIEACLNSDKTGKVSSKVDKDSFVRCYQHAHESTTYEEAEIVYRLMNDKWMNADEECFSLCFAPHSSVFNVILNFCSLRLHLIGEIPVCRYRYLNEWHEVTERFGEDLMTTAYLASYDLMTRTERSRFDWPICLGHDSNDLNVLMGRKMVDLHAHLNATTDVFELNWISLMNQITDRTRELAKYDRRFLSPNTELNYSNIHLSLSIKVVIAAALRLYLVSAAYDDGVMEYGLLEDVMRTRSELELMTLTGKLQEKADLMAMSYGWKCQGEYGLYDVCPDYAIRKLPQGTSLAVMEGERKLMYMMYQQAFSEENPMTDSLFYLYLVLKEELRKEMVMQGKSRGFAVFSIYNRRKNSFTKAEITYQNIAEVLAVTPFFEGKKQNRYIELRITPKNSASENTKRIRNYEKVMKDEDLYGARDGNTATERKIDFIIHFIKRRDDALFSEAPENGLLATLMCRHQKVREDIQQQAKAIAEMDFSQSDIEEIVEDKKIRYSSLLVGIDAASSELVCRPEVFGQAYRYLSSITLKDYQGKRYNLGKTFHVGEVFYDVVDGLRAIDEVMKYLNFGIGDRLGHATVLGVNVERYYERHNYCISCSKQELLDNMVWLYVKVRRWLEDRSKLCEYLRELYVKYFRYIYDCQETVPDIYTYYQSWLLRGDNPELYLEEIVIDPKLNIDPWGRYGYNEKPEDVREARKNRQAKELYRRYHYDGNVKQRGGEAEMMIILERMRTEWVTTISSVQDRLLTKVERKHIAIECNPTSNLRIGEVKNYEEHPIVKFYNHGLDTEYPQHQVCVSINTDDKGIFATSLDREYSMMALSLEKGLQGDKKNSPRDILEWLDHVRKMAQEQMFNQGAI